MLLEEALDGMVRDSMETVKTPPGKSAGTKPKLLIVDDDDAHRMLLVLRLSETFDVVAVASSEHGLGKVLVDPPDCILLDLFMPRYSGLELCWTLTSLGLAPTTPIIVMSGQTADTYKKFCMDLGAQDYLEKPLEIERLRARIMEILKQSADERESGQRIGIKKNLVLRGFDKRGNYFEVRASTEDMSANGFNCVLAVQLETGTMVEMELLPSSERMKGRATVIHVDQSVEGLTDYSFEFMEKSGEWNVK
jgi:DNA-binding response OmpR family regulator